jgi:2'-5' RNA ligase
MIPGGAEVIGGGSDMPFAIEMFLDDTGAAAVRAIWRALAEAGISDYQSTSGARPHVTLAAYAELDLSAAAPAIAAFAAAEPAPSVSFASVGCFPTDQGVVFLAPVVTRALLDLHARFHATLRPVAGDGWPYYQPDAWVPHCTLAFETPPGRIAAAVDLCRRAALPLSAHLDAVGIVEFRPIAYRGVFPFDGA